MKVLLDSNVIIAAFAARGLCNELFEVCVEGHTILISEKLLDEIRKNLTRKIKLPAKIADEITNYLRTVTALETISTRRVDPGSCRDADDLEVLELAVTGQPDCVVTGDPDLLILKEFEGIPILSLREFWELLAKKKPGTR